MELDRAYVCPGSRQLPRCGILQQGLGTCNCVNYSMRLSGPGGYLVHGEGGVDPRAVHRLALLIQAADGGTHSLQHQTLESEGEGVRAHTLAAHVTRRKSWARCQHDRPKSQQLGARLWLRPKLWQAEEAALKLPGGCMARPEVVLVGYRNRSA